MFYFPIPHPNIAEQISDLLNTHSQLSMQRNRHDILMGRTNYVVETHGRHVIGAVGMEKVSYQMSELKHLVVHPDWRGQKMGVFLGKRALQICETPTVYATARANNQASLVTLGRLGFHKVEEFSAHNGKLTLLVRTSPKWKPSSQTPKSSLPTGIPLATDLPSYPDLLAELGKTPTEDAG